MSLPYDVMKDLASAGANLVVESGIPHNVLQELVAIAKSSGASITVTDSYPYNELQKAASTGGNRFTVRC